MLFSRVDRRQKGVGALVSPAMAVADIPEDIPIVAVRVPKLLHHATNRPSLRVAVYALDVELVRDDAAFHERAVLCCQCEEGQAFDLFPQVEAYSSLGY